MNTPFSYLEISKSRLINNIKAVEKLLGKRVKIAAVVKANAYGHGQNEVSKILEPYVDFFQVDDLAELILLRKITQKPALVFGYVSKDEIREVLKLNGIISVYDTVRLKLIDEIAQETGRKYKIHVKIDADFGRQGILSEDVDSFIVEAKKAQNVIIDGVYSHFANVNDISIKGRTKKQIDIFLGVIDKFRENGFNVAISHISATFGILACEKKLKSNLVRIGIGLYGMWPTLKLKNKFKNKFKLKPIIRWVSHVAQVKMLPEDFNIGYGMTCKTSKPTKIAVVPLGFCDGYDRRLSNCGEVLIKGKRCKVLGRVSMNMFVVDVSHLINIKTEDEVILLGAQGNETITAEEISEKVGTINEEITTRINGLLPRVIVK